MPIQHLRIAGIWHIMARMAERHTTADDEEVAVDVAAARAEAAHTALEA